VAWLGGPVIGIANGTAREKLYKDRVGDLTAHQISTATALALFSAYFWELERRRPIPTRATAAQIGATWGVLTIAFEFGFGHYVAGESWEDLLADYNLTRGRLWGLIPLWMIVGPATIRALAASTARFRSSPHRTGGRTPMTLSGAAAIFKA
jgi:hypothetical protein